MANDDFEERPTALVVLLPAADDPVNAASSEDIAHATFVWFGDVSDGESEEGIAFDEEAIRAELTAYAAETTPITVPVAERGELGDDSADVLFLENTDSLTALRDGLMAPESAVLTSHDATTQYPSWTAHVTLGYPDVPATADYAGDEITFDRFALWIGNERTEYPMGKQLTAAAPLPENPEDEVEQELIDDPEEPLVDEIVDEIPVHGVATILGRPTGDGRMFDSAGVSIAPLPQPMGFEFESGHGSGNSRVSIVGRIDEMWIEGEEVRYNGVIMPSKPYANLALEGIIDGSLNGVSVKVDDVALDVSAEREEFIARLKAERDGNGDELAEGETEEKRPPMSDEEIEELVTAFIGDGTQPTTTFSQVRIRNFDIVAFQAYVDAWIALGTWADEEAAVEISEDEAAALAACGCLDGIADDPEHTWAHDLTVLSQAELASYDALEGKPHAQREYLELVKPEAIMTVTEALAAALESLAEGTGLPLDVLTAAASPSEFPFDTELTSDTGANVRFSLRRAHQLNPQVAAILRGEGHQFAPGTKDGPGWLTNPKATARIRRYWTKGKGAAKIAWGTPGDFNRCRAQLGKYVQNPEHLAGLCANMHKEVLGIWPAQHLSTLQPLTASGRAPLAIVAAAREPLSAALFRRPDALDEYSAGVVVDGDHVYGYVAEWGVCHLSYAGVCTVAPHSSTDYAYFATGYVETDEGDIRVGQITMETGHAPLRAKSHAAAAHYDNTGAAVADVTIGEDMRGIWFSGAMRATATEDQRHALKASGRLSGDWRDFGQSDLELVAALAVNVPGFPIQHTGLAASAGRQTALIAAGVVPVLGDEDVAPARVTIDEAVLAAAIAQGIAQHERHRAQLEATRPFRTELRTQRVTAALARIEGRS